MVTGAALSRPKPGLPLMNGPATRPFPPPNVAVMVWPLIAVTVIMPALRTIMIPAPGSPLALGWPVSIRATPIAPHCRLVVCLLPCEAPLWEAVAVRDGLAAEVIGVWDA